MVYWYVTMLALTVAMLAYANTFTLFPSQTDLFLHQNCIKKLVHFMLLTSWHCVGCE